MSTVLEDEQGSKVAGPWYADRRMPLLHRLPRGPRAVSADGT